MKKIITRKLTDSVDKVKKVLKWSFSKKNFLYGLSTDKEEISRNNSLNSKNSQDINPIQGKLKSIKEEASNNIKVKLFRKEDRKAKRMRTTFAKD